MRLMKQELGGNGEAEVVEAVERQRATRRLADDLD